MKFSAASITALIPAGSMLLAVAIAGPLTDDKLSLPSRPNVAPDEHAASGDASSAPRDCPPTPLKMHQILGSPEEGSQRVHTQNLEIDIRLMLEEAERIREERAAGLPDWTPERQNRAAPLGIRDIVTDTRQIIADADAAAALGKMFFWDQRIGSDGQTACASCHYNAGADVRAGSFGVAQRRMAVLEPAAENGLEKSIELEAHHVLRTYEFQWGGMIDFPDVLDQQAARAVQAATAHLAGLTIPEETRQQLARWVTYLKQFAPVAESELAELHQRLNATGTTEPSATGNRVATARSALVLAAELVTYAVLRRESPSAATAELLDEVNRRMTDVEAEEGTVAAADSSPATKRQRISEITKYLAPLESRTILEAAAENEDDTLPDNNRKAAEQPEAQRFTPEAEADGPPRLLRHVLERNSPTVINAALSDRLYHDGRASAVFNGYDHLGDDAGTDGFGKWMCVNDRLVRVLIRIPDSAAASQATAPLLSASEMSWFGRQYHHVARKILDSVPLAGQQVHPNDSLLRNWLSDDADLAGSSGRHDGTIRTTYRELIRTAFHRKWWQAPTMLKVRERDALTGDAVVLSQMEANFSLFWGLAIQEYEKRLISDDSEFDRLMSLRRRGQSLPKDEHTENILLGFRVFNDHACADCHSPPEFAGGTFATVFGPMLEFEGPLDAVNADTEENEFVNWLAAREEGMVPDFRIESMPFRPDLGPRIYDAGYYNVGVSSDRPGDCGYDPGNGGFVRPPIDVTESTLLSIRERFGSGLPVELLNRRPYLSHSHARRLDERTSVATGAFRAGTLRNITLTAPYFHNGAAEDLDAVLEHYRGQPTEVAEPQQQNDSPAQSDCNRHIFHADNRFLHPAMMAHGDEPMETDVPHDATAFVRAFFESLTDPRVKAAAAPFDHPSLAVPNSRLVNESGQTAESDLKQIGATGGTP